MSGFVIKSYISEDLPDPGLPTINVINDWGIISGKLTFTPYY